MSEVDAPIRVFTASVASFDDEHSAAAYGIAASDHDAIAAARKGRVQWEALQAHICDLSTECVVTKVATVEHEVQNAVPRQVADAVLSVCNEARGKS